MYNHFSPIIKPAELLLLMQSPGVIIIDASNGKDAKQNYAANHIHGALFVDLNTQLADIKPDAANGGRHPLPTIKQFSETLSSLGITAGSHVVIYDDKNGANAAARFWWMLRAVGHEKVQVLDGGFEAAFNAGIPLTGQIENPVKTDPYKIENWLLPLADIHEIDKAAGDENFIVIDVRDAERYNGEKEPIDLVAGHIPGAINIPYTTNLDSGGSYLSPAELKNKYRDVFHNKKAENIIVHCGSGVTACHTLLAIAAAGLEIPKLYVGSWSEWSRTNRPVATTNKP